MFLFALVLSFTYAEEWDLPVSRMECHDERYGSFREPDGGGEVDFFPADTSTVPSIFPVGAFDRYICTYYSHQMSTLGEGPLVAQDANLSFRLTIIPTFDHPMTFHVRFQENGATDLRWAKASGYGGYDPGILEYEASLQLTQEQSTGLRQLVDATQICSVEVDLSFGTDGTSQILEVAEADRYCLLVAWSPGPSVFRQLEEVLMEITGSSSRSGN